jgi:epoxyqueuosine reductase
MHYLHRQAQAREHPQHLLEHVQAIVMTTLIYGAGPAPDPEPLPHQGKIARYARGADYHELLWRKLEVLGKALESLRPGARWRAVADTAPLLERDYARLAGLGWFGKNTMLIHPRLGSYTVLGALLTDAPLEPDPPFERAHCGTCTRCLDACPTQAFPQPYVLDANLCISYWTIEHRGAIPEPIVERLQGWAFGCDICQEVCPWNRKAPAASIPALLPRTEWSNSDLLEWLSLDDSRFRVRLRGTALRRAKPAGLRRTAALILGERRVAAARPLLEELERSDEDPAVRAAAIWALERLSEA